ncbi:MAG: CBS domain-containing protein [Bacteroidales bacterium]|nr:CBS domain-containing protein [Bacteroidales bacterium]
MVALDEVVQKSHRHEISSKRLGAAAVVDQSNHLKGIITDGDLRRMLEQTGDFDRLKATDIMTKNPKTITSGTLVSDALSIMRSNNITQLLVVDEGILSWALFIST